MDVILQCIQTQLHLWLLAIRSSTMNFMNSFYSVESIQFIWNIVIAECKRLYADSHDHDLLPIIIIIAFIGFNFMLFITALFFNKSNFNSKVNQKSQSSQASEHSNAELSNESIQNSNEDAVHQQDIVSILESEQGSHPAQHSVETVLQIAQSIQPSIQRDSGHIETAQFESNEEFAPEGYSSDSEATLQASDQRRRSDSLDSQSTCEVDDLQVGGAVGSEKVEGWLESDVQEQPQRSWNFSNLALVVVGSLAWISTNAFEPQVAEVVKVETLSVSMMLESLIDTVLSEPFAALKASPELFATIVVTGLVYLFFIVSVIRFLFDTVKSVFSSGKDQPLPPIDEKFEDSDRLLVDEKDPQLQSQNGQVTSSDSEKELGEVTSVTSTNQGQQGASHLLKLQSINKVMSNVMYHITQGADLELTSLREENDGLKMENDDWRGKVEASRDELSSVQSQYEELIGKLETRVKEDGEELKEVKEKLRIESTRAEELEAEVVERDLQIVAKSDHNRRLQDTIDSKDLELLAQQEEIESLRKKKKLDLTQSQLSSQESKLFELELERNDDLNAVSEEISELEQEVVQLTKEIDDLNVQREEIWDELDEAYGDQAALETFKDELELQVAELEEISKESQEKAAELVRVNELLKKKVSKLQKQNADILQDAMWNADGGMRTKYEPAGPYKVQAKNGFKRGEVLLQVEAERRRKGLRKESVKGTKIASSGFSDESGMASSKIFGH